MIVGYGIIGVSIKNCKTVKKKKKETSYHNSPGFIYLIGAKGTSRYKIGVTTRTPEKRLSELNGSQSPYPLVLVDSIYVENATAGERILHTKFKHYKRHGEWFEFSPKRVDDVREEFTKVAGTSKRRLSRLQKMLLVCVFCFTVVFVLAVMSSVL